MHGLPELGDRSCFVRFLSCLRCFALLLSIHAFIFCILAMYRFFIFFQFSFLSMNSFFYFFSLHFCSAICFAIASNLSFWGNLLSCILPCTYFVDRHNKKQLYETSTVTEQVDGDWTSRRAIGMTLLRRHAAMTAAPLWQLGCLKSL